MAIQGPQKTVLQLVAVVVTMGALSWASVPFYDWFCRVTGFGGVTGVAEREIRYGSGPDHHRSV